jgi:hypothetical protein
MNPDIIAPAMTPLPEAFPILPAASAPKELDTQNVSRDTPTRLTTIIATPSASARTVISRVGHPEPQKRPAKCSLYMYINIFVVNDNYKD